MYQHSLCVRPENMSAYRLPAQLVDETNEKNEIIMSITTM